MEPDIEMPVAVKGGKKAKKKKSGAPALPALDGEDSTFNVTDHRQSLGNEGVTTLSLDASRGKRNKESLSDLKTETVHRPERGRRGVSRELPRPADVDEDLGIGESAPGNSIFAAFSALGLSDEGNSDADDAQSSDSTRSSHRRSGRTGDNTSLNGSRSHASGAHAVPQDFRNAIGTSSGTEISGTTSKEKNYARAGAVPSTWTPTDALRNTTTKRSSSAKKGNTGVSHEEDAEIEAILAELEAVEEESTKTKSSKKQKRKAKKATQKEIDDQDASFEELLAAEAAERHDASDLASRQADEAQRGEQVVSAGGDAPRVQERPAAQESSGASPVSDPKNRHTSQAGTVVDQTQSLSDQSAAEERIAEAQIEDRNHVGEAQSQQLTAAQKKRLKKKQKEASKKAEAVAESSELPSSAPSNASKAIVRRILAEQQRRAEEEERRRQEEEDRLARERERQQREEEEARQREEERRLKKEAERARREQLRREGKLLSKSERQRKQRVEAFIQLSMASGAIAAATLPQEATKRSKRVYDDRKKKPRPKDPTGTDSEQTTSTGVKAAAQVAATASDSTKTVAAASDARVAAVPDSFEAHLTDAFSDSGSGEDEHALSLASESGVDDDAEQKEAISGKVRFSEPARVQPSGPALSAEERRQLAVRQRLADEAAARTAASAERLRSPIICILGHVDTGKTKLLDKIRHTHVQEGEAGGITQQIGATYFPIEAVRQEAAKVNPELTYRIPSLLIIDTPGHESFTNLRSRGSSLCDIAILVVDIMHGLEQQTLESIELLKMRKTPFIVALNKVDRLYGWKPCPMAPIRQALEENPSTAAEFERRVRETKTAFAEIGFNAELYWENTDYRRNLSLVPTSAISGEGIPDLLMLLVQLPQRLLVERLKFIDFVYCTVLEVKVIDGLGTTIDVVLTGGALHEADTIVVCGLDGPIVTTIRALLTPHPMKELRVKGQYIHHKRIEAAQGVKISAEGLEKAVAGTQMFVARNPDEIEYLKEEVMADLSTTLAAVDTSGVGVYVQASTLGSLEALLEFLRKDAKIPVSGVNIGPVHKRDVVRASTMLEHRPEYAVILAFDVKVEREAREEAENLGVQIFTADIIYHLFDHFRKYMEQVKERKKRDAEVDIVFPVCATILPDSIFNKRDPLILGVRIDEGILRCGSSLVAVHEETSRMVDIGRVLSIESNKKSVTQARRGDLVAIKVSSRQTSHVMYGRQFDHTFKLYSRITRKAIDLLKELYRDELTKDDWQLVLKLKKMFGVL